MKENPDDEIAD